MGYKLKNRRFSPFHTNPGTGHYSTQIKWIVKFVKWYWDVISTMSIVYDIIMSKTTCERATVLFFDSQKQKIPINILTTRRNICVSYLEMWKLQAVCLTDSQCDRQTARLWSILPVREGRARLHSTQFRFQKILPLKYKYKYNYKYKYSIVHEYLPRHSRRPV